MDSWQTLINNFENLLSATKNSTCDSRDEITNLELLKILEDLNGAIQSYTLNQEDLISVIAYCTSLQPSSEDIAARICAIILSLYEKQSIRLLTARSEDVILFISNYILKFLENEHLLKIALKILNLTLKDHTNCTVKVCDSLCVNPGFLIKLIDKNISKNCTVEGTKVLQLIIYEPSEDSNLFMSKRAMPVHVISNSQKTALNCLKASPPPDDNCAADGHISVACLSVIYNVLTHYPSEALSGLIVSVCRPYIFYQLNNVPKAQFVECEIPNMSDFLDDEDEGETRQGNVANRKRKRRLRRKKNLQPRSMIPVNVQTVPTSQANFNFSRLPLASREFSLKPQWMKTEPRPVYDVQPSIGDMGEHCSISSPTKGHVASFPKNRSDNLSMSVLRDPALEGSVRQCALHVMNAVVEISGKQNKFSFWPQLMCQEPSIMTCILRDPDVTARMAALQVVNTFLIDSNPVLSLSTDSDAAGSFTTLSKQLGTSVRSLHRCMALALLSEKMAQVLIRILKTIELLFENVNYSKLQPGLLSKIIVHVKYFLKYKDSIVRANAFSVMVSFLKIKPKTSEIESILSRYQIPLAKAVKNPAVGQPLLLSEEVYPGEAIDDLQFQAISSDDCFSSDSSTNSEKLTTTVLWVLERCIDSLLDEEDISSGILLQVKMQAIKVLNALVSDHFNLIQASLPVVLNVITFYCNSSSVGYHHAEEGLIERVYLLLGSVLNTVYCYQENGSIVLPTEGTYSSKEELLQLWLWALQNPLAHILTYPDTYENTEKIVDRNTISEDNKSVCSTKIFLAGVTVLSNTSGHILQEIGEQHLFTIFKTLTFLVTNTDVGFKLCGIRIMGLTVGFPAVQDSPVGVKIVRIAITSACQILSMDDHNVKKNRLLSAWVLANISASLHQCRVTWEAANCDLFLTKEMIVNFFKAAIFGSSDKDTIRPAAIRSLGNLVSYLSEEIVSDAEIRQYIDDVVNLLITSCVSAHMKSRWNACHALGTILKSSKVPFESASWMGNLICSLSGLVENFKNFKVRILACSALCNISSRSFFVTEYITVWKAFLNGVADLGNICGMQEVHHRDDLICQLSYGICHLITLLEFADLEQIREKLETSRDTLQATMQQGNRLMSPEKSSCFLRALEHVNRLLESDVIATRQETILKSILRIIKMSIVCL